MSNLTLKKLSENWLGLTDDYRPSAFWFWNSVMEPEAIEQNISEMNRQGIREILIHPIHGLDIEYLSDIYFERYRYALDVARKHGLRVWIYDEFGWPSGNVGGKLLERYPEHKSWFLRFSKISNGTIIAKPFLSDRILDNTVGAKWAQGTSGYLDTLSRDAVQCFIKMTHERYYEECREFFKDVITGFFTDEPVMMIGCAENQREIWNTLGLPWTPKLPNLFKKKFGYDIETCYRDLAQPGVSKVKTDYRNLVNRLHTEAYHSQIGKWCKEHGVKYTGHIGEDLPLMQVRFSGSAFTNLGTMDEPGVDMLGCELYPEHRCLEQVLVSSIARHKGRKRVYCEAFGVSPFSIRLGEMLKGVQMLGVHGVNDIALMGFHESLDGVRKRMYWPPLFKTAPWWPFYPEFRDACARSVGLTSLGKRKARYAVLYPQYELEQSDIFRDAFSADDPVVVKLSRVASAIYQSGEAFEFVFPENLANLAVRNGLLAIGDAEYSELIIIGEFSYAQENLAEIQRLSGQGGRILHAPSGHIISSVKDARPSWSQTFEIECRDSKKIRIYEYEYSDGSLVALFNTDDQEQTVSIHSCQHLTEWDSISGDCISEHNILNVDIEPDSIKYFSASPQPIVAQTEVIYNTYLPLDMQWYVSTDHPNTARFTKIQFYHNRLGWLDPEANLSSESTVSASFIPSAFKGYTRIKMRAEFNCDDVPAKLGVVYEKMHFTDLVVNGKSVEFKESQTFAGWDTSCRYAEISELCRAGKNIVEGVCQFERFETALFSHGFFTQRPVMPTCDVCLAGVFKAVNGKLVKLEQMVSLPLNLQEVGWGYYSGRVLFTAIIDVDQSLSKKILGLEISLVAEDALEVILDGSSLGRKIVKPYRFELDSITGGQHKLELMISTTSGNILDEPAPSGVLAVNWLI